MSKTKAKATKKSALVGATPTLSIETPGPSALHNVTIVDANADTIWTALGISEERKNELQNDIIAACRNAITNNINGDAYGGTSLSLFQIITVSSQHCQSDNELVLCTALVSEAYALNQFDELAGQEGKEAGVGAVTNETTTEDTLDGQGEDGPSEEDFNSFLSMMFGEAMAAELAQDGSSEDDDAEA